MNRLLLVALCLMGLYACGGSGTAPSSVDGGTSNVGESFTATINGEPFRANLTSALIATDYPRRLLIITARESCTSGWAIHLQLERLPLGELLTTGAYSTTVKQSVGGNEPLVYREFHAILANDKENVYWDSPDLNGAGSGRANISTLTDTVVQGTFSFDARSRINNGTARSVMNGSFRVTLGDSRMC